MTRVFEIPKANGLIHEGTIVAIIEAILDKWAVLSGVLYAPQYMLDSGQALASTKLVFSSSIHCMVDKVSNEHKAEVFGVLFGGKGPCRVEFGRSFGGSVEVMPMSQSKLTVLHFLLMGYHGTLDFSCQQVKYIGDQPSFSCSLDISKEGNPSTVSIVANREEMPEHGYTVAPIVKVCERLNLAEAAEKKMAE
jgi:hypothetical protein